MDRNAVVSAHQTRTAWGRPVRGAAAVLGIAATLMFSGISALSASASAAEDWPTFGHDAAHSGVSADTAIGATTAPGLTLKWKASLGGGKAVSSPAVVYNQFWKKDIVYAASTTSGSSFEALDAATGTVIWSIHPGTGIQSSPAVVGNTVYFGANDYNMYAVNATTGVLQCTFYTGGGVIASPVVADDGTGPVVYFGDNGTAESTNAGHEWAIYGVGGQHTQCTQKWMFNGWLNNGPQHNKAGSWSSPALATDTTGRPLLVFGSSNPDNAVYALDARDGTQLWRFQTLQTGGDQDVGAAPTIGLPGSNGIMGNGLVFVDGKDKIEVALDLLTGAQMWSFSLVDNSGTCTNPAGTTGPCKFNSVSSTVLVNNWVIVNYWMYTFALDAATGAMQWRSPTRSAPTLASPTVSGAPGNQVIVTGDLGGTEYAYSLIDGSRLFSYTPVPGSTSTKILSTPTIAYGMVFFEANATLYALG